MGFNVTVRGVPASGTITRQDVRVLQEAVSEQLERLRWGGEAFKAPARAGRSWEAVTRVEQEDEHGVARDVRQVLALAVLCSRALPEWSFEVRDDFGGVHRQVGVAVELLGGELREPEAQKRLNAAVRPVLEPRPVRTRRRAVAVSSGPVASTFSSAHLEAEQEVATLELEGTLDPGAPGLVRCSVRQLQTTPAGATPFLARVEVTAGTVACERLEVRLLLTDDEGRPLAVLDLGFGVPGEPLPTEQILTIQEADRDVHVAPGARVAGVKAWFATVDADVVQVVHSWSWRTLDGDAGATWRVACEIEAEEAQHLARFAVDWFDRSGRVIRTEAFESPVARGRQLITRHGPAHDSLKRAQGPARVRCTGVGAQWVACSLSPA